MQTGVACVAIALCAALTLCLAPAAGANTIIIAVVPSNDPDAVIYCSLHLAGRQITALQTKGLGMQNPRRFRWWASAREDQAMLDGLSAFLAGAVPSQNPLHAPVMHPPYVTVDWYAQSNGGIASGRFQHSGTALPGDVRKLLAVVMPGSYCAQWPVFQHNQSVSGANRR